MGQNDLFGKEQELLDRAKALLESHKSEGCVTIEDFQALATPIQNSSNEQPAHPPQRQTTEAHEHSDGQAVTLCAPSHL
jgi:hypothetical protein